MGRNYYHNYIICVLLCSASLPIFVLKKRGRIFIIQFKLFCRSRKSCESSPSFLLSIRHNSLFVNQEEAEFLILFPYRPFSRYLEFQSRGNRIALVSLFRSTYVQEHSVISYMVYLFNRDKRYPRLNKLRFWLYLPQITYVCNWNAL
jgi:hypothetical protein